MGSKGARRHAWSRPWGWYQATSHLATFYVIACFAALVQPAWQQAGRTGDILLLALFWTVFMVSFGLYIFVCVADTKYHEEPTPSLSEYESRSCEECMQSITRLRVKHCQTCGCTEDFDHHCHYLNVCIGGRTYAAWFLFVAGLLSLMVACGYAAMDALAAPERYPLASKSKIAFYILLGVEVVVSLVLAAFLLCLLAQHVYFIYEGITTLEYVKDQPAAFPSLPPKGWREAVLHGECYVCREVLELMEADDTSEVWFCTICQSDVGKAGVKFYFCESCDNVNVCPICYRAAKQMDIPIVTYRVSSLRRRADAQLRHVLGQRTNSRISSHSSQREARKARRTLTAVVAGFEGHSGDAQVQRRCCCPRGSEGQPEEEDGDESGSSSEESEGLL